ncbi:hypothetical protein NX059_006618 [Plenodomus lindquistii]|nr:hypothetical protein NX059_006618 [Plenodomus lindquistii]
MRPRHVLITGGSRGIGLAIAQLFAKNKYRCTLISRSEDDLKKALATLTPLPSSSASSSSSPPSSTDSSSSTPSSSKQLSNHHHAYIPASISTPDFWSTSTTSLPSYLPKPPRKEPNHPSHIDVLVNCAGITQASLFTRTSAEDLDAILATNLTSVMLGTRFLLRNGYLRKSITASRAVVVEEEEGGGGGGVGTGTETGGGHAGVTQEQGKATAPPTQTQTQTTPAIINIASLLGTHGGHGAVVYAASKAGLLGFTRALASEYASHGVRVNAVVPGYVDTGMTKDLNNTQLSQRIPLGRFAHPHEIAAAALFLAQNEYAHNCVVNLDGGLSAI